MPFPCSASPTEMSGHHVPSIPGRRVAWLWDGGEGTVRAVWFLCTPSFGVDADFSPASLLAGRDSVDLL